MRCFTMISSAASLAMTDNPDEVDLDGTVTWRELLAETEALLARCDADSPKLEAKWIVEEVTGATGAEFAVALDGLATTRGVAHLDALVGRRCSGEPIQYVLGHWAFRSIDLLVDRRVLIPRPETEVVAGLAIAELDRFRPDGGGLVVDLGTGTGAIGLSIASERPGHRVLLTDASADALAVARANLVGLGRAARGVEISEGSWFDAVPDQYLGQFDVIVSNPPYIAASEQLPASVTDWEPEAALRSDDDGLADLRFLVEQASEWLAPTGALVLEIGHRQATDLARSSEALGYETVVHCDLAGLDRALVFRRAK